MPNNKKIIFSGVAPSGNIHIGNYLGAIKQWVELQNTGEYQNIFCVVDEHALTTPQDPAKLRSKILEVFTLYLALGIDPEKSIIFVQSHVPQHSELNWILSTITPVGELERMTQFKDKAKKTKEYIGRTAELSGFDGRRYLALQNQSRSRRRRPASAYRNNPSDSQEIQQRFRANFRHSRAPYQQRSQKNNGLGRPGEKDVQIGGKSE